MPVRHCYRVRLLPPHIRQFHEVSQLLSKILNYTRAIDIHSLASSIDSIEDPPTKVATVTFDNTPDALSELGKNQWKFSRTQTLLSHNIVIDTHFHGFTVLNEVDSLRHAFDCIAISGLAGHAFGSWNGRDSDGDFMWLRDTLPTAFPNMRVMLYGYDTQLIQSESFQTIPNLASTLLHQLHAFGFFEPSAVPVIFIAHSLGGIVVKETLSQIANLSDVEDGDRIFLSKVKQVIFFGVPHQGMMITHLLPMVRGQPNEAIIHALGVDSPYLQSLDEQFLGLTRGFDVISVYETHKSQTPQLLEDGTWKRDGLWEILVKPESAVQRGSKRSKTFEINRDHSNLVKFSETDASLGVITRFIRAACNVDILKATRHDTGSPTSRKSLAASKRFHMSSNLQTSAEDTVEQAKSQRDLRKQMVDSLYNYELDYRLNTVEPAHPSTLDWLFLKNKMDLKDWLQQGKGIYWIRGKPGSGKSTIMKHIVNHYGNEIYCHRAQQTKDLELTANFFLFRRGSLLQKSYEGLIRALLYQILSGAEQLADLLLPAWLERSIEARKSWTTIQLEAAWDMVIRQQVTMVKMTLFLDALDEFDGPTHKIANFVHMVSNTSLRDIGTAESARALEIRKKSTISAQRGLHNSIWTQVRVCFASRAWNVFIERFGVCPGFEVEHYTSFDIKNYIYYTALADRGMGSLLSSSDIEQRTDYKDLLSCIHTRAQGVFIWVKLVLENLLHAVSEGANAEELDHVLESLPEEVDALYEMTLTHGSSRESRREAYVMLEILVRSPSLLTMGELQAATDCALSGRAWALTKFYKYSESGELKSKDPNAFEKRLRNRCRGMIDFTSKGHVQLMHDTVRTFVTETKLRDVLLDLTDRMRYENGHTFLAKLSFAFIELLAGAADLDVSFEHVYRSLYKFQACFRCAEQTTGIDMGAYVRSIPSRDLLEVVFISSKLSQRLSLGDQTGRFDSNSAASAGQILFALKYGLEIYLGECLITLFEDLSAGGKEALIISIMEIFLDSDAGNQLHCLSTLRRLFELDPSCVYAKRNNLTALQLLFLAEFNLGETRVSMDSPFDVLPMVKLLLEAGSDPNMLIFVFHYYMSSHFNSNPHKYIKRPLHISYTIPGLAETLIMAGADVNCPDATGRTPLDELVIAYCRKFSRDAEPDYEPLMTTREHCETLVSNGAKLTTRRRRHVGIIALLASDMFRTTWAWREFERNPWIKLVDFDVTSAHVLPLIKPAFM